MEINIRKATTDDDVNTPEAVFRWGFAPPLETPRNKPSWLIRSLWLSDQFNLHFLILPSSEEER
jgi:hypothetical protein